MSSGDDWLERTQALHQRLVHLQAMQETLQSGLQFALTDAAYSLFDQAIEETAAIRDELNALTDAKISDDHQRVQQSSANMLNAALAACTRAGSGIACGRCGYTGPTDQTDQDYVGVCPQCGSKD